MKKLVLVLAVVFSASLFSCSSKADKAADAAEEATPEAVEAVEVAVADTVTPDSVVTDTIVAAAVAE